MKGELWHGRLLKRSGVQAYSTTLQVHILSLLAGEGRKGEPSRGRPSCLALDDDAAAAVELGGVAAQQPPRRRRNQLRHRKQAAERSCSIARRLSAQRHAASQILKSPPLPQA